MVRVEPTNRRTFTPPTTGELLQVTEVPESSIARIAANSPSEVAEVFTGRLFEVTRELDQPCWVTSKTDGTELRCLSHPDGSCDAIDRVQCSGLVGCDTKAICYVCKEPLFNETPIETIYPTGRYLRPYKVHDQCALSSIANLAHRRMRR
jgi:hypothetical protein